MELFTELAAILRLTLALWLHKDKNKYIDDIHKLEGERDEELQKPIYEGPTGEIPKDERRDYQDHAALDDFDRRLCNLARAVRASIGGKDTVLQ